MNLNKLINILRSTKCREDIDQFRNELVSFIPELSIMVDYDQKKLCSSI